MDTSDLDPDVIAQINAGRKIEAIKLLREQRGIGLKEAKELVDAYEVSHAPENTSGVVKVNSNSAIRVIIFMAILAYIAYRLLE